MPVLTERDADVSNEQQSSGCYEECDCVTFQSLTHPYRQLIKNKLLYRPELYQCQTRMVAAAKTADRTACKPNCRTECQPKNAASGIATLT